jgi:hypothetical protein
MCVTPKQLLPLLIALVFVVSCDRSKYVNNDILKSITAKIDKIQASCYRSTDYIR